MLDLSENQFRPRFTRIIKSLKKKKLYHYLNLHLQSSMYGGQSFMNQGYVDYTQETTKSRSCPGCTLWQCCMTTLGVFLLVAVVILFGLYYLGKCSPEINQIHISRNLLDFLSPYYTMRWVCVLVMFLSKDASKNATGSHF